MASVDCHSWLYFDPRGTAQVVEVAWGGRLAAFGLFAGDVRVRAMRPILPSRQVCSRDALVADHGPYGEVVGEELGRCLVPFLDGAVRDRASTQCGTKGGVCRFLNRSRVVALFCPICGYVVVTV